jgi:hypothetical protein
MLAKHKLVNKCWQTNIGKTNVGKIKVGITKDDEIKVDETQVGKKAKLKSWRGKSWRNNIPSILFIGSLKSLTIRSLLKLAKFL